MNYLKTKPRFYGFIYRTIRLFYPKYEIVGAENIPQEACIVVGNHCQLHGPLAIELNFTGNRYTWCVGQLMNMEEAQPFALMDFWGRKPKATQWFYKGLSYLVAPVAVYLFNNAQTIPVYRDTRILTTFKTTAKRLGEGATVVIFPEQAVPCNNVIYDFQEHFINVAKLHYKKTGHAAPFVPMYIAPTLRKICLGTPTYFNPEAPIEEERQRIRKYLMDEVTKMGLALPRHTVIPFPNIPKKEYTQNTPLSEEPPQSK